MKMNNKEIKNVKQFFNDGKNIVITALITIIIAISPNINNKTLAELNNEVSDLKEQVETLSEENDVLTKNLTENETNKTVSSNFFSINDIEKYQTRINELEKELEGKNNEIQQKQDNINTITIQKNELEKQVTSLTNEKTSLEGKLNKIQADTSKSSSTTTSKSVTSQSSVVETNSEIVYITNTGEKYHRAGCRYLKSSKIEISKSDAISRNYTACSVCRP